MIHAKDAIDRLRESVAKVRNSISAFQRLHHVSRDGKSRLQNRVTYQVHDLSRSLPQYAQTFDVIVSNLVLNDVPHYRGFAATLGSMTKPDGRLVLSSNNPYSDSRRWS